MIRTDRIVYLTLAIVIVVVFLFATLSFTHITLKRNSIPVYGNITTQPSTNSTNPSLNIIKRKIFPQRIATLCLAVLSCNRHDLLVQTLDTIITHMENNTKIPYEIGIVEQCSSYEGFEKNILNRYQVESWTFKHLNTGIGYGLNSAWYGTCSAPYILSLEDDWKFIGPNKWIERGIDVLQYYEKPNSTYKVLGVFGAYNSDEQTVDLKTDKNTNHRLYLPEKMNSERAAITAFCNGGTLISGQSLRDVGLQVRYSEQGTERVFKERALKMGYRMVSLHPGGHSNWERAFEHLGDKRHLNGNKRAFESELLHD